MRPTKEIPFYLLNKLTFLSPPKTSDDQKGFINVGVEGPGSVGEVWDMGRIFNFLWFPKH